MYGRLIRELERMEVMTVVDSDGEPMRQACAPSPTWSPNVLEAEELVA